MGIDNFWSAQEKRLAREIILSRKRLEHFTKYGHFHIVGITGNLEQIMKDCEEQNNGKHIRATAEKSG